MTKKDGARMMMEILPKSMMERQNINSCRPFRTVQVSEHGKCLFVWKTGGREEQHVLYASAKVNVRFFLLPVIKL